MIDDLSRDEHAINDSLLLGCLLVEDRLSIFFWQSVKGLLLFIIHDLILRDLNI